MSDEGWARPTWARRNHYLWWVNPTVHTLVCWRLGWNATPVLLSPQPADDDPANCRECQRTLARRRKDAR